MKVNFTINYRLDLKDNSNGRQEEFIIPVGGDLKQQSKDEFLLSFCGEIYLLYNSCVFYKDVQVMAPFLERPARLKYMIRFPNNFCAILDAALKSTDLRKKAKELKDHFDLAVQNNKTKLKINYPVLLTVNDEIAAEVLEREYNILILSSTNAINFFKQIMSNGKSNQ